MPELTELRALLHDRQVKEGALGTFETSICLDPESVEALNELEAERESLIADHSQLFGKDDKRLSGSPVSELDLSELDERIETAKQAVKDTTIVVVFRALSSVRYQEILNDHPDANDNNEFGSFLVDLCAACYRETRTLDGEKLEIGWEEIRDSITYGEWEPISLEVLTINRRRVDVPFSLRPSRKTR